MRFLVRNKVKILNQKRNLAVMFLQNMLLYHWRCLLLILMGVYLPLQVVEILEVKIWQNEGGFSWDVPILMAIHATGNPQLDMIAVFLTNWGSSWTVLSVLIVIALILLQKRRLIIFAYLFITATDCYKY